MDKEHVSKIVAHIIRLVEDSPLRSCEVEKNLFLEPNSEEVFAFSVAPEKTIEVCLAKFWSSFGSSEVDVELKFHGFSMHPPTFLSTDLVHRFDFVNTLRHTKVTPTIAFDHFHQPLFPEECKIQPLGERDILFDGQQIFRLLMTYKLNVPKSNDYTFSLHGVTDYLYESPVDDILVQVFTESKKYVGATGPFPNRYKLKLEKGDYVLQIQIRLDDNNALEKLRDAVLVAGQKISSQSMDLYHKPEDALKKEGKKVSELAYHAAQRGVVYGASVNEEKLPKGAVSSGCYLTGKVVLLPDEKLKTASSVRARYVLTSYNKKSNKALSTVTVEPKKNKEEKNKDGKEETGQQSIKELKESIRDLEIKYLSKITEDKLANELFTRLNSEFPEHLPLLQAQVDRIVASKNPNLTELNSAVDLVVKTAKPDEVLKFYGAKTDMTEDEILQSSEMEKRKNAIVSALFAKVNFYLDKHLKISTQNVPKCFRDGLVQLPKGDKKTSSASKSGSMSKDATPESTREGNETPPAGDGVPTIQVGENSERVEAGKDDQGTTVDGDKVTLQDAVQAYKEFARWGDLSDDKGLLLNAKYAVAHARYGTALRNLNKIIEDKSTSAQYLNVEMAISDVSYTYFRPFSLLIIIFQLIYELGWIHLSNNMKNGIMIKHRGAYRPF